MGKKIRRTLWMRYVDFEKVKDILHLVAQNNSTLRVGDLENLAIQEGILVKKNGKPFAHSPRYHYRKVMENLNLLTLHKGFYCLPENEIVHDFLGKTTFKIPLSAEAEDVFAKIIVDNGDCKRYFFDLFMESKYYNLSTLRANGRQINVETRGKEGITLRNSFTGQKITLVKNDEVHAVFWGLRLWALELNITDELFMSYQEGRIIYPINPHTSFSTSTLESLILKELWEKDKESHWITLHIPSFIKKAAISTRLPIKVIKKTLREIGANYPAMTVFVPSSMSFINIRTPFSKQDDVLFKSYLVDGKGGYISHLKLHKDIINILERRIGDGS